jgi:hypothetical protein
MALAFFFFLLAQKSQDMGARHTVLISCRLSFEYYVLWVARFMRCGELCGYRSRVQNP